MLHIPLSFYQAPWEQYGAMNMPGLRCAPRRNKKHGCINYPFNQFVHRSLPEPTKKLNKREHKIVKSLEL